MPRLTVLAIAALAAAAALAHARPALASDPPSLSTGDNTSLACGEGHTFVCYWTATYTCVSWSSTLSGAPVCSSYITILQAVYRD